MAFLLRFYSKNRFGVIFGLLADLGDLFDTFLSVLLYFLCFGHTESHSRWAFVVFRAFSCAARWGSFFFVFAGSKIVPIFLMSLPSKCSQNPFWAIGPFLG